MAFRAMRYADQGTTLRTDEGRLSLGTWTGKTRRLTLLTVPYGRLSALLPAGLSMPAGSGA
jgi:hypothetical protein